ncbi:uncharacterized protein MKK02DRAFT_38144 [Dioszegia hungarica]|uniref:Uncharacterized protein n=1 Tax=Dioszegia hungarica TaxID=4972 RepID=A0AA38H636_9TREE|nr:uncharacterized protein MKK02DRAFT_38144 [Dioszegia hungarica]KAI9633491.1 hypothetical protein MKK02DRAFT_38144 [Dioszegia hungarica]
MSVRSALINTARAARQALPKAQVAPRRAASTHHKPSSNTPWMIGSAAVFGSLTAFILMPSGDKAAHEVHEHIDAKGAGAHVADGKGAKPEHEDEHQNAARDLMRKERESGERPGLDEDPKGKMVHAGESRPRTEIPSKRDDEKPHRRGASTGDKFDGTIDGTEMKAGIANKSTEKEADSKSQAGIKTNPEGTGQKDTVKPDNVDDSDKPSEKDIKSSIKKAEQSNSPKTAMDKEETGGASSGSSNSSTPDNVDDSDKPSDKDIKDSIKQAERSNSPLATMQEEVDDSGKQV